MGQEESAYHSQSHRPRPHPVIEVETNVHALLDKDVLFRGKEGIGSRRRKHHGSVGDVWANAVGHCEK